MIYFVNGPEDEYVAKQTLINVLSDRFEKILELVYEYQMLVLYEDMKYESIFFLNIEEEEILDFICMRLKFNVFYNLKEETKFDRYGYLFFLYICKLHSNNLFHGDIKPENLFEFNNMISSDAGTLLILDAYSNESKYIIH